MFFLISVCVAVSLLSGLSGQKLLDGPCSKFKVSFVKPLYQASLVGSWYLYGTFDDGLPLHEFDCIRFLNSLTYDKNINSTEFGKNLATNEIRSSSSLMVFNKLGEGRFTYKAGDISQDTEIIYANFLTAYGAYIEFVCADKNGKADCYLGIFTKLPVPDNLTVRKVNKFLDDHQIDRSGLRYINHDYNRCYAE